MTNRFAGIAARTLATLGITQAASTETAIALADAAAAPASDTEDGTDPVDPAEEGDENPDGTPKKGKGKDKMPACDGDAEAAADADVAAAITLAATQSAAKATADANARWADVIGSDAAKGRTAQATALLANTALDAAGVKAALAAFPKEAAATFADRMAGVENPPVTAGAGGDENAAKAGNYGWDNVVAKAFPKTAAK